MPATTVLLCSDCGKRVAQASLVVNSPSSDNLSPLDQKREKTIEFWWCRDCVQGVCKSCHLMKGHSEHRSNEWKPDEVYRACVQALEGRCSRRSKIVHDHKLAVKEFVAKVEAILLTELGRTLELQNEPDRRLISRLNRALTSIDLRDERPALYHVPSPSRPAWKVWNLDHDEPRRMSELIDTAGDLLDLPREENYELDEMMVKDRSEWNARQAAEALAATIGARFNPETASLFSRSTSPDRWDRRGQSADCRHRASHLPVDANVVFARERPSVMSFRERSLPSEDGIAHTVSEGIGSPSSFDSKPGSVMSSIPMYPADQSLPSIGSSSNAVTPTPPVHTNGLLGKSNTEPSSFSRSFGSNFLTRPIAVQAFNTATKKNAIAVSDSCGGVYITDRHGHIDEHVMIKNSSASSITIDEKNEIMYVSVMQSKGRSVHTFDIRENFKKIEVIACPKDPRIEMSRTRWLTVAPRGHLFMTSGDNIKSALWCYVRGRKGWKTLKESRKTRYQYLSVAEDQAEYKGRIHDTRVQELLDHSETGARTQAITFNRCFTMVQQLLHPHTCFILKASDLAVVLLTCDAANNRLLLFVVDHSLSLINEYDLSKTYRLPDYLSSPASAIVDAHGNLLVLDYATGKLWILLSGVKGQRRMKQIHFDDPIHPQEALGISSMGDDVLVASFGSREIRVVKYLDGGQFRSVLSTGPVPSTSSPIIQSSPGMRRSCSLPRPPESAL